MGKTGSKFVIGLGFALIFLSLFMRTWKAGSSVSADAANAMVACDAAEAAREPLPPVKGKVEFPAQAVLAGTLNITEEDFKKNCGTEYDAAKKKVDDAAKSWNDDMDKAGKGDWKPMKEWVTQMGDYYKGTVLPFAKDGALAKEQADAAFNQRMQAAQVGQWRWFLSFVLYFGVLFVTAGALLLAMSGEGNEKLGGLVILASVLFFICAYWGNISTV